MTPIRSALAIISVALGLLAAVPACGHAPEQREPAAPATTKPDGCDSPQLDESLRTSPSIAVILVLHEASAEDDLAARQDRVLHDLGDGFRVARRYGSVSALAGQLTAAGLARARVHPDVRCIQLDGPGSGTPPLG